MGWEKQTGGESSTANQAAYRKPRRGWERVPAAPTTKSRTPARQRHDGPSPAEEILAKHDAELARQAQGEEADGNLLTRQLVPASRVICF